MLRFDVDRLRLAARAGGAAMRRMPGMTVTDLIPIHEDDPGGSTDSQHSTRGSHESFCLERPRSSLQ